MPSCCDGLKSTPTHRDAVCGPAVETLDTALFKIFFLQWKFALMVILANVKSVVALICYNAVFVDQENHQKLLHCLICKLNQPKSNSHLHCHSLHTLTPTDSQKNLPRNNRNFIREHRQAVHYVWGTKSLWFWPRPTESPGRDVIIWWVYTGRSNLVSVFRWTWA